MKKISSLFFLLVEARTTVPSGTVWSEYLWSLLLTWQPIICLKGEKFVTGKKRIRTWYTRGIDFTTRGDGAPKIRKNNKFSERGFEELLDGCTKGFTSICPRCRSAMLISLSLRVRAKRKMGIDTSPSRTEVDPSTSGNWWHSSLYDFFGENGRSMSRIGFKIVWLSSPLRQNTRRWILGRQTGDETLDLIETSLFKHYLPRVPWKFSFCYSVIFKVYYTGSPKRSATQNLKFSKIIIFRIYVSINKFWIKYQSKLQTVLEMSAVNL